MIDVSVNEFGANILIETNEVKKVYYVGKSFSSSYNYYDIGVLNKVTGANWTEVTTVNA